MHPHSRSLLALALILTLTAQPLLGDERGAVANANPAITINVDAGADQHPIDPRIYGSSWASAAQIASLGLTQPLGRQRHEPLQLGVQHRQPLQGRLLLQHPRRGFLGRRLERQVGG